MSFAGYWIKVNGTTLPTSYIKLNTLKITPLQKQDKNSYRDSNGKLHRTIVSNKPSKLEFDTIPLKESDMLALCGIVTDNDTVSVQFYNPRTGTYRTENMYTPSLEFTVYNSPNNKILYNSMRLAFIGH